MAIFISYRRSDASGYAGRLYDRLSATFGASHVFMDIDAIAPGEDFPQAIRRALASCEIVLALIGPHWLAACDDTGRPRMHDPRDLVRQELATALNGSVTVIPLLVGGVTLPQPQELPEDIRPLLRRQAFEVSDARFHYDLDRLIDVIKTRAKLPDHEEKPGQTKLILRFTGGNNPQLKETELSHPRLGSIPRRAAGGNHGDFRWDQGVQALCIFLLKVVCANRAGTTQAPFSGTRSSPAGSLSDCLTKKRSWLRSVFGGCPVRDLRIMTWDKRGPKKDEQVSFTLETATLSPTEIHVHIEGSSEAEIGDPARLRALADEIERQFWESIPDDFPGLHVEKWVVWHPLLDGSNWGPPDPGSGSTGSAVCFAHDPLKEKAGRLREAGFSVIRDTYYVEEEGVVHEIRWLKAS